MPLLASLLLLLLLLLIYLSVWLFLCTDPLVYSCGRDGLSVTLVLVLTMICTYLSRMEGLH